MYLQPVLGVYGLAMSIYVRGRVVKTLENRWDQVENVDEYCEDYVRGLAVLLELAGVDLDRMIREGPYHIEFQAT